MQKFVLPVLFVVVGIPLILYSASSTNDEMNALKTNGSQAREAICMEALADAPIAKEEARSVCKCFVTEADRRGFDADVSERQIESALNSCARQVEM